MTTLGFALCFSLVFLIAAAEPHDFKFDGRLSFNSTSEQWGYRSLAVGNWNLGLWSGAWWHSVQAEAKTRNPVFHGDFIWGSVYAGTGKYPLSWMGFYGASVEADRNISNPGGLDWATFNVSVSTSFIASSFLAVLEKNATGSVVNTLLLKDLVWTYNITASNSMTNSTAGIYAFVFDGRKLLSAFPHIQLQFVVTELAGVLNLLEGGVLVVPRALESIVIIEGWTYANPDNYLTLRTVVGSLQGSWTANGQITAGSGDSAVYYRFAETVWVDGKVVPAKISGKVTGDISKSFESAEVVAQLTGRYSVSASCEIVDVDFPVGAQLIVYDPTMGSGESPYPNNASNSDQGLVIGLSVAGALLVVIVVIAAIVFARKRGNYQNVP